MTVRIASLLLVCATLVTAAPPKKKKDEKPPELSPLDKYIIDAYKAGSSPQAVHPPGSTWSQNALLSNLGLDLRAGRVNDLVTIVVSETFSAVASGDVKTQRQATGETSRGAVLTANMSARVTNVLPNGYLVIEGTKRVQVSSENQVITLRGVIRPVDLIPPNTISSNLIAQMELQVNGKGVVNDSIRRPNILYRILMGI